MKKKEYFEDETEVEDYTRPFFMLCDAIEQVRAEREAEDALDEKRLQDCIDKYGEEEGHEVYHDLYDVRQVVVKISPEDEAKYRAAGMDGVDMAHLFGKFYG